jgi:hypothetical protein
MGMPGGPMPGSPVGPADFAPIVVSGPIDTYVPPPPLPLVSGSARQTGSNSNDSLFGSIGDDEFYMSQGSSLGGTDSLAGGAGNDQLTLEGLNGVKGVLVGNSSSFTFTLTGSGVASTITGTGIEQVYLKPATWGSAIEGIDVPELAIAPSNRKVLVYFGSSSGDTLDITGDSPDFSMVYGSGGADAITLKSNSGEDFLLFTSLNEGADSIANFESGVDKLVFFSSAFGGGGSEDGTPLDPTEFSSGTSGTASTINHRFVFDTDDKKLYFDADGSGSGAAVHIATTTGVSIGHDDILLVS